MGNAEASYKESESKTTLKRTRFLNASTAHPAVVKTISFDFVKPISCRGTLELYSAHAIGFTTFRTFGEVNHTWKHKPTVLDNLLEGLGSPVCVGVHQVGGLQ
jgi:hypothetical protein